MGQFWAKKLYKNKQQYPHRFFSVIPFFMIFFFFFFTKRSQYSHYTYCLQGQSTIGLRLSMSKMPQYSPYTYCIREELAHFGYDCINTFWSQSIMTVWYRKSQTKNQKYCQKYFELCQLSMKHFPWQTVVKLKLDTTWLIQFMSLSSPNLFISELACTTCTKQVLWLKLNYKKQLKCVGTTNFLTLYYVSSVKNDFISFFYLQTYSSWISCYRH